MWVGFLISPPGSEMGCPVADVESQPGLGLRSWVWGHGYGVVFKRGGVGTNLRPGGCGKGRRSQGILWMNCFVE